MHRQKVLAPSATKQVSAAEVARHTHSVFRLTHQFHLFFCFGLLYLFLCLTLFLDSSRIFLYTPPHTGIVTQLELEQVVRLIPLDCYSAICTKLSPERSTSPSEEKVVAALTVWQRQSPNNRRERMARILLRMGCYKAAIKLDPKGITSVYYTRCFLQFFRTQSCIIHNKLANYNCFWYGSYTCQYLPMGSITNAWISYYSFSVQCFYGGTTRLQSLRTVYSRSGDTLQLCHSVEAASSRAGHDWRHSQRDRAARLYQ